MANYSPRRRPAAAETPPEAAWPPSGTQRVAPRSDPYDPYDDPYYGPPYEKGRSGPTPPTVKLPAVRAIPSVASASPVSDRALTVRPSRPRRQLESLGSVPVVVEPGRDVRGLSLDPREAFVLSLIDGKLDLESLIDATPMASDDTLRILERLLDEGVIALR